MNLHVAKVARRPKIALLHDEAVARHVEGQIKRLAGHVLDVVIVLFRQECAGSARAVYEQRVEVLAALEPGRPAAQTVKRALLKAGDHAAAVEDRLLAVIRAHGHRRGHADGHGLVDRIHAAAQADGDFAVPAALAQRLDALKRRLERPKGRVNRSLRLIVAVRRDIETIRHGESLPVRCNKKTPLAAARDVRKNAVPPCFSPSLHARRLTGRLLARPAR